MAPQGWIELQLESAWTVKYEKSVVWNPTRWSKGCEREHWHPPVCSESYKEIHMDPLNILTLELTTNLSCSSIECETNTCPGQLLYQSAFCMSVWHPLADMARNKLYGVAPHLLCATAPFLYGTAWSSGNTHSEHCGYFLFETLYAFPGGLAGMVNTYSKKSRP